jgi:F1F0 ATPase subunit 2
MTWIAAILAGAAIALVYCAALWLTIDFAASSAHPLAWFGITSMGRLGLVCAAFYGLALLGPEMALAALFGFAATRTGVSYWAGGAG